jgi:hypothetical protein
MQKPHSLGKVVGIDIGLGSLFNNVVIQIFNAIV